MRGMPIRRLTLILACSLIICNAQAKITAPAPAAFNGLATGAVINETHGMPASIDHQKNATDFALTVRLVQGNGNLVTRPEVSQCDFNILTAPDKKGGLAPAAGHGPNQAIVAAGYNPAMHQIRPLAQTKD